MGCRAESPHFKRLRDKFPGDELVVLDVFIKQDLPKVSRFVRQNPFPFTVLRDEKGACREVLDFKWTPLIVVIDAEGVLRYRGGVTDAEVLEPIVAECLAARVEG